MKVSVEVDFTKAYGRVVVDTNMLLSAALSPAGAAAQFVDAVLANGCLVFSARTFAEFESRIWKPKFDRYVSIELRKRLLADLSASAIWVEIDEALSIKTFSRDADDDAFIHAAFAAGATRLVTGDEDLLVLKRADALKIISVRSALAEIYPTR